MSMDKQQLIELAERYYPSVSDFYEPALESVPDVKAAYHEAWNRAPSIESWFETVSSIQRSLPGTRVHDATPGRSCGSFRVVAHVKSETLVGGARLETNVIGFRSVLAPVYGLAWAQRILAPRPETKRTGCPWRSASAEVPEELRPVAETIGHHIERDSGFQRLPVDLAGLRVPGAYLASRYPGEATLFDALLDPDPANVP